MPKEENKAPGAANECYYDQRKKDFLVRDKSGGWTNLNETSLKRVLKQSGLESKPWQGEAVSQLDSRLIEIQTEFNIHFAGPLAGYDSGFYRTPDCAYLVTRSPTIIEGKDGGDYPLLRGILNGLLGERQLMFFMGWLHFARRSMLSKILYPSQALAIAGPKGSGKSLIQKVITHCLGGREAKPYQYMSGQTPFNAHLFGAEHLMIEDESPATDHRARRTLASMIKSITVNEGQSCHEKGHTPLTLRPFWRLSITVNDEPENLMVLPIIDESLEDKITLLQASLHPMPMKTGTPEQRAELWAALLSEIPYFIHSVETFQIQEDLLDDRMGIRHFHHPELMAKLDDLSAEFKLLSIIDNHVVLGGSKWTGRASDLEKNITGTECPYYYEARKLLSWPTACGTFLGRLRRKHPDRFLFEKKGEERDRIWTILPAHSSKQEPFEYFEDVEI